MSNPLDNLKKYDIVLASGSPRRRELLAALDVEFAVEVKQGIDESYPADMAPDEVPLFLSAQKARAYMATATARQLVITADTVVITGGCIMGKPHSEAEARAMLRSLSGGRHHVVTGVTLLHGGHTTTFGASSTVEFASLTDGEINYYVERYRPLDKAGAYGIQEWIGCAAIRGIEGSFYNVMGLPVQRLYEELKKL